MTELRGREEGMTVDAEAVMTCNCAHGICM